MTHIYFVRHAQPDSTVKNDRFRPLTKEGLADTKKVTDLLKNKNIHFLISSPYKRSIDTVKDFADTFHMEIHTDEDLREREIGSGYLGDPDQYIRSMWNDFHFKAEGAECLADVQQRNIRALTKILRERPNENVAVATHGTALCSILNYYDPQFRYDSYIRVLEFFPYIIRLDFEEMAYIGRSEELIIKK